MGRNMLSGAKAIAYQVVRGTAVTAGALTANTWYEVKAYATTASALPGNAVGTVFESPDTSATAITLASGDEVYPLTMTRICKTDADYTAEEGAIETTDDCEEGFTAKILDGYKEISGSLGGFATFDDSTGQLQTGALDIFKRFINHTDDDGEGVYTVTAASNEKLLLFILMNRDATIGQKQNWLIVPVYFTSLGAGAGLKDAQKRDISWVKAPGVPSIYTRTVFAADVIS